MIVERHRYWPSYMHMGDCSVCGNLQDDPVHDMTAPAPSDIDGSAGEARKIVGWSNEMDHDRQPIYEDTPQPACEAGDLIERAVLKFAEAALHGDDEHRAWLMAAAEAFVKGQPLPPPAGRGRTEAALAARLAALQQEVYELDHRKCEFEYWWSDELSKRQDSEALAASLQRENETLKLDRDRHLNNFREECQSSHEARTRASSLQRGVETLTGALMNVHNWIANANFYAHQVHDAVAIDEMVLAAINCVETPYEPAPEQGGKP